MDRIKVLFVSEAVTLAHLVRPIVLASTLDPQYYEIHFAAAPRYGFAFTGLECQRWPIYSRSSKDFLRAVNTGKRLFTYELLQRYVRDDISLIEQIQPDIIVGDLRISLAVSAVKLGIPYVSVTNSYWSPYGVRGKWPVPVYDFVTRIGHRKLAPLFSFLKEPFLRFHAWPINRIRTEYGLPTFSHFFEAFTYGDYTLYADVPWVGRTLNKPDNHHYVGLPLWAPEAELPAWWESWDTGRPTAYVTMGSSGDTSVLPEIIAVLKSMRINALVATAGRVTSEYDEHEGIYSAEYLPGDVVAARSDFVICNGGSPTTYQALAQGVPVLGIATNLDQFLAMHNVERATAGILLRSDTLNSQALKRSINSLLTDSFYKRSALRVKDESAEYSVDRRFPDFLKRACNKVHPRYSVANLN